MLVVIDEDDIRFVVLLVKLDILLVYISWSKFNYSLFIDNDYYLSKEKSE